MNEAPKINLPFYLRLTILLACLGLLIGLMYAGRHIVIPVLLSSLFAILLRPLVTFLTYKWKINHVISVLIAVGIFLAAVGLLALVISWQVSELAEDWQNIKKNLLFSLGEFRLWINETLRISYAEQKKYMGQITQESWGTGTSLLGSTLSSFKDAMVMVLLLPIYTCLILYYRGLFKRFLYKVYSEKFHPVIDDIILHIKRVIQRYLWGLIIEMGIVCALTTTGLMIVGVKYAFLFGLISAVLNLIPYIGITIASLITLGFALAESGGYGTVAGVLITTIAVQLIDNELVVPLIVGSRVRINPLVTLIAVVAAGTLAGFAGMFLAIPLTAIIKVIFDRVEGLKPWGFLMGSGNHKGNR